jgi:hypothetical protein
VHVGLISTETCYFRCLLLGFIWLPNELIQGRGIWILTLKEFRPQCQKTRISPFDIHYNSKVDLIDHSSPSAVGVGLTVLTEGSVSKLWKSTH